MELFFNLFNMMINCLNVSSLITEFILQNITMGSGLFHLRRQVMRTTPKTAYFKLNQAAFPEPYQEQIPAGSWKINALSSGKELREFYDTFEWQAFEKKLVIVKKKGRVIVEDLNTGQETASLRFSSNRSSFFSASLPSSRLKEQLMSCSSIRAFSRLCSVNAIIHTYRILDRSEKTIGILTSETLSLSGRNRPGPFMHFFSLSPLRGYEREMEQAGKRLFSRDQFFTPVDYRALFLIIMNAAGRSVHDYSSKLLLTLDKDAPVHESARQLLRFTYSVMRRNEEGITKDIDSEFLHDYRVAIRRTRSILKQLKGVFDPVQTARYLNAFRELGQRTSELRDRDVYLLRQPSYCDYLPGFLQLSLRQFFSDISASRKSLHNKFRHYLASGGYRLFLEEWEAFLNQQSHPDLLQTPGAELSTLTVALGTIKKAWRKVIRNGRLISRETTDAELHALRIDCKKLRYLLEFFSSVFSHKTITPVIRQLKELQDNLGDFVDFSVQLRFLQEHLESALPGKENILAAAATGGLIATLHHKKEDARREFHRIFAAFDNEDTERLFADLLTGTH